MPGNIGRGVRQGCLLSPLLFNVCIEELIQEAMEKPGQGVNVGSTVLKAIRFADDQAVVADTEKGLQEIMDVLQAVSKDYNMTISFKKTKVMCISRKNRKPLTITVNGTKLEQLAQFVYLGSLVTEDEWCCKKLKEELPQARRHSVKEEIYCEVR